MPWLAKCVSLGLDVECARKVSLRQNYRKILYKIAQIETVSQ